MIAIADKDGDGNISFEEFKNLLMGYLKPPDLMTDLKAVFHAFDHDGSGAISPEEMSFVFQKLAHNCNKTIDPIEIERIVRLADKDGNGEITLEEFELLLKLNPDVKQKLEDMLKPSPLEYLNAFSAMPSTFRKSTLYELHNEGIVTIIVIHL